MFSKQKLIRSLFYWSEKGSGVMGEKGKPDPTSSPQRRGEGEQPIAEIDARRLAAARRKPAIRKFHAEALEQNERLHREGLIHP
jgi:hypothetical protein